MNKEELILLINEIPHPAIDFSLTELGILTDLQFSDFEKNNLNAVFAFPFPVEKIPIADRIIQSVKLTLENFNFSFDYTIRVMTETERLKFMKMEREGWRG